jgi:hypothetical protein
MWGRSSVGRALEWHSEPNRVQSLNQPNNSQHFKHLLSHPLAVTGVVLLSNGHNSATESRERVCLLIKWAVETAWKFNRLVAHVSKLCPSFGFTKGQEMDDGKTKGKVPMVRP